MSNYDFTEMSSTARMESLEIDVDITSGELNDGNVIHIYELHESSTSGDSGVDSDFDECGGSSSSGSSSSPTLKRPRDGQELLRDVGSLLDGNGIGNALVGEGALAIMGVPIIPRCIAFMISDGEIDQAAKVLRDAQYPECKDLDQLATNPENFKSRIRCHALTGTATGNHPIPAHHFHADRRYPEGPNESRKKTRGVFLYCASQMLAPGLPMPPARPPPPEDPYYLVTSDKRLYRPSFRGRGGGGGIMLNCWGRQSTKSYPVKMLHPARYVENLVYLMLRDIGYSACNGWKTEFDCMLACSRLLPAPAPTRALAAIDVGLEDVPEGPIRDWIGLHNSEWAKNQVAICIRFAALHREMKQSGQLGEPLMTPQEATYGRPQYIENWLMNMEEGKPPSFHRALEASGWTCQLM
ncbi:uncharacterized protein BO66DRAFT_154002 [Aspergillus aculeatinus CBS 121060]|uniref:Uncharacterized protein n=1 Tax=Aspergillus aculeatinus CBS 121060 TaxID=1448322 RepID=A0ACD1H1X9_9EURO|nr:hypothetical protein BO66DRAFT_154002 [Aspergillus aculeatinus CBS 121060]RAH67616.1 hypothetical protein BO66DRAFT_154002 [Aspergillus aculeatinus CBS 121060]